MIETFPPICTDPSNSAQRLVRRVCHLHHRTRSAHRSSAMCAVHNPQPVRIRPDALNWQRLDRIIVHVAADDNDATTPKRAAHLRRTLPRCPAFARLLLRQHDQSVQFAVGRAVPVAHHGIVVRRQSAEHLRGLCRHLLLCVVRVCRDARLSAASAFARCRRRGVGIVPWFRRPHVGWPGEHGRCRRSGRSADHNDSERRQ